MSQGKDRDKLIRPTAEAYHLHPVDAAEIVDISEGWSDGDVIDIIEAEEGPTSPREDAEDGPPEA